MGRVRAAIGAHPPVDPTGSGSGRLFLFFFLLLGTEQFLGEFSGQQPDTDTRGDTAHRAPDGTAFGLTHVRVSVMA